MAALIVVLTPATPYAFGIGMIVGEPTGLSFKQWLSGGNAVDAGAAWSFDDPGGFEFHMDYLYHMVSAGELRVPGWKLYLGIGGRLKLEEEESIVGVRIPFGTNYLFKTTPFDFFFEVAPILDLAPATEFRMNFGLGLRYYFGQPWRPDLLS